MVGTVGTSRYLQFRSLKWPLTRWNHPNGSSHRQMAPAAPSSSKKCTERSTPERELVVRRCSFWGPQSLGETEPRFKRISRISDFKTKKWGFFHGDNKKNLRHGFDQRAMCVSWPTRQMSSWIRGGPVMPLCETKTLPLAHWRATRK
jgi:hypothetical protein